VEVVTNCDHLRSLRFSPVLPYAFTEHAAIMAAKVLNCPWAVQMTSITTDGLRWTQIPVFGFHAFSAVRVRTRTGTSEEAVPMSPDEKPRWSQIVTTSVC